MILKAYQYNKNPQINSKRGQILYPQCKLTALPVVLCFFLSVLLIFFSPAWNNLTWNSLGKNNLGQNNLAQNNFAWNNPAWGQSANNSNQQRNAGWAKPLQASGVDNFYQVNNWLYRSAQPDAEGFKNIEAMGIKTVINLRETNKDPKAAVGTELILINAPITTWSFNDNDIIKALRAVIQAQRPVLVHCRHGADRTGLIIALVRVIDEGWSVEDAKKEMLEGGYGFHAIWKNIPKYLDNVDIEALKEKI